MEDSDDEGDASEEDELIKKYSKKDALLKLTKMRLEDVNLFSSADV